VGQITPKEGGNFAAGVTTSYFITVCRLSNAAQRIFKASSVGIKVISRMATAGYMSTNRLTRQAHHDIFNIATQQNSEARYEWQNCFKSTI
jgi:hypothetical protein